MSEPEQWPSVIATTEQAQEQPQQQEKAKSHLVGFYCDEGRFNLLVNVADMMHKEGVIKTNSVSALLAHSAYEACNTYLYDLMRRVKQRQSVEGDSGPPKRVPYGMDPRHFHVDPPPQQADDFFQ